MVNIMDVYKSLNISIGTIMKNLQTLKFVRYHLKTKKCVYKSFLRPRINYVDILYDKRNNENFQNKSEKAQKRACLAISNKS